MNNKRLSFIFLGIPSVFLALSFIIPVGYMIVLAFQPSGNPTGVLSLPSMEQFYRFFSDSFYFNNVLLLSLGMGALSGVVCLILGYPMAWFIAREKNKNIKTLLIILAITPLWINTVVRTLSWQIILADNGLINQFLRALGLNGVKLSASKIGVFIGLVQICIPYVVLPLVGVLESMSVSLEEAAYSVGASPFKVFRSITFPLSLPGVMSGALMVFALNAGSYAIPQILGGGKVRMLAVVAYEQAMTVGNFPFASLLGLLLLFTSILCIIPTQILSDRTFRGKKKRRRKAI